MQEFVSFFCQSGVKPGVASGDLRVHVASQAEGLKDGVLKLLQGCEGITLLITCSYPLCIPYEVSANLDWRWLQRCLLSPCKYLEARNVRSSIGMIVVRIVQIWRHAPKKGLISYKCPGSRVVTRVKFTAANLVTAHMGLLWNGGAVEFAAMPSPQDPLALKVAQALMAS